MASEKAVAIVIRTVDFSESSLVVTLFSREFGKLRALAKGGRRPKGPFEAALDLLSVCRIVFLHKSSEALDLLTEAKLERRFRPARGDLASLYTGYYVGELLGEMTDDGDPHPELFDLAEQTLSALGRSGPVPTLMIRFELQALRLLGHLPSLDRCVNCGGDVLVARRVAFGQTSGGVLCRRCRDGQRNVVWVSEGVIDVMRRLSNQESSEVQLQPLDRHVRGELRAVLNRYLSHLLGKQPRMHEYLGTLADH